MFYTSTFFRGETASRAVKIRWNNQIDKFRILKLKNTQLKKKSLIEWKILSSFLNIKKPFLNQEENSRRSFPLSNLNSNYIISSFNKSQFNLTRDWSPHLDVRLKKQWWFKYGLLNKCSKSKFRNLLLLMDHNPNQKLNIKQNKKYRINFKNQLKKNIHLYSFISNFLFPINNNYKQLQNFKISNKKTIFKKEIFNNFQLKSKNSKVAIRFLLSGRLNGVRMKRKFAIYNGNISTQTHSINSNYIHKNIYTKWGVLGLRIWNRRLSMNSKLQNKMLSSFSEENSNFISQQNLKKYKPVTPSLRHRLILKSLPSKTPYGNNKNLWKFYKFNKRILIKGFKKFSGRNNQGRITSFRKGGGHKKLYRYIDFLNQSALFSKAKVINLEYNPFNNANLALLKIKNYNLNKCFKQKKFNNPFSNSFFYIIAPEQLQIGDELNGLYFNQIERYFPHLFSALYNQSSLSIIPSETKVFPEASEGSRTKKELNFNSFSSLQIGELSFLKDIPVGTYINNVEIQKGKGSQIARSAGTYCILLKILDNNKCIIKLPSNKIIEIDSTCTAHIGQVSNSLSKSTILGKAGASRWLGIRPRTRGEAMNAVDHPHGGKNHGPGGLRNQPKNRWGKLAKWQPSSSNRSKN